jgi:hypothetical protein
MIVAIRTALWPDLGGLDDLFGAAEFLYIALLLWLSIGGAGAMSLDFLIAEWLGADRAPGRPALAPFAATSREGLRRSMP